jgi:MFS family permease
MLRLVGERYRTLLGVPGARGLLVSSVLSRVPLGMSTLAILLLIRDNTGSFGAAGATVGAYAIAAGVVAPLQGALIDRLGQRPVLVPCAISQATLLAALVLAARWSAPLPVLFILAALAGMTLPPLSACARTVWSQLTMSPQAREAAYAIDATSQELIWALGPLLVGGAADAASPSVAVLLWAAITLVGTIWFAASPLVHSLAGGPGRRDLLGALGGVGLRLLLGSIVLSGIGWGALEVALPALATHVGEAGASGLMLALLSFGSLAGGVFYSGRNLSARVGTRYRILLAAIPVFIAPLIIASSFSEAIALTPLAGIAWAPMLACQYVLVGSLAPTGTVTEAFTWNTAGLAAGMAAGSIGAGILTQQAGVDAAFAYGATGVALAAILAICSHNHVDVPTPADTPQLVIATQTLD